MSLSSVLQTGLTGLIAAEQMVARASSNLADPATYEPPTAPGSSQPTASDPDSAMAAPLLDSVAPTSSSDIGQSLVELILASTQFRSNIAVLKVADELLAELTGIKRMR